MDDLCPHNQALEEYVIHIQQHHQEVDPAEEIEVLDPNISDENWGTSAKEFQATITDCV